MKTEEHFQGSYCTTKLLLFDLANVFHRYALEYPENPSVDSYVSVAKDIDQIRESIIGDLDV